MKKQSKKKDPKLNVKCVTEWRKRMKLALVQAMGGKCQICGYNKNATGMDFHHHFGPKSFSISAMLANIRRAELIIEEAVKCVMLCANCHREVHAGITDLPSSIKPLDIEFARSVFAQLPQRKSRVSAEHSKRQARIHSAKYDALAKSKRPGHGSRNVGCPIRARKEKIKMSGIDFSRFGWVEEVAKLLEITPQASGRWIRKHMPEFYVNRCFRRVFKGT